MSDYFEKLPWFIKEYIHNCKWTGFRDIQNQTFSIFYSTDDHILISSGTSSGKTEAAMFPIIASLYNNPTEGIGALYIGPLKALIDDQFERMGPILGESELRITGWHGDIGQSRKTKLMDDPSGILQITPESLQNIISNHPEDIIRLFENLRFVIIDEVHAFMSSDRGLQLLCCLQRLEVMAGCNPRRIGLSATIANRDEAADWLAADTGRHVGIVSDDSSKKMEISIRYNAFPLPSPDDDGMERKRAITSYYLDLFRETHGYNCIVFTNSRQDAEKAAKSLRLVAEAKGFPNEVSIHHGSISKEIRKKAESDLKDPDRKTVTVSTVTLELGINIGDLDKIVQIDAPFTCSGMIQRMGRSGRRGGIQSLTVMCNEDAEDWWSNVDGVSMNLVKAIAMSELIKNESWTEPAEKDFMPFSLLYHQTMEYLRSGLGAKMSELYSGVLTMYPFKDISKEQYKLMLLHLVNLKHVLIMQDKTILIGPEAEKIVFGREFCSVFSTEKEIDVKSEGKTVGSIQNLPQMGELIQLAGHVWTVTAVYKDKSMIEVVETDGEACNPWKSGTPPTHDRIMKTMKRVLGSDDEYDYLDEAAQTRLSECRKMASDAGMLDLFSPRTGGYRMYPWVGTIQFDTLTRILRKVIGTDKIGSVQPYYIDIRTNLSEDDILSRIDKYISNHNPVSLVTDDDLLRYNKYDKYVPESLLAIEFASDRLDFDIQLE